MLPVTKKTLPATKVSILMAQVTTTHKKSIDTNGTGIDNP